MHIVSERGALFARAREVFMDRGWIMVWLVALAACQGSPQDPVGEPEGEPEFGADHPECPPGVRPRPDHLGRLVCSRAFMSVAVRPQSALFANTSIVKFVIDLQDDDATYFFDSSKYGLHFDFCDEHLNKEGLDPVGTHAEFNDRQYRSQDRRFLLGTVAFYADQGLVLLEFATGDLIEADQILFAYQHLVERLYFGPQLVYRPISLHHEEEASEHLEGKLPIVTTHELFEGITFQPLNPGRGYGYLRLLGEQSASSSKPTDIVVLREAPNDIPPVGGIITEVFQTPLSHVNILSKNRGTPNMALRGALTDARVAGLADQLVSLEVTPQGFNLRPARLEEAERYWAQIRPRETFVPPLDLEVDGLPALSTLDHTAVSAVGAKAANMAEMTHIEGLPLPEAPFAVPFVHYWEHMQRHGLDEQVEATLDDPRWRDDLGWRAQALAGLRAAIQAAPLDLGFQAALYDRILTLHGTVKVRLRSSTNSEDLPGFNGAGLYTSVAVQIGNRELRPEDGVRLVWASLWSEEAVAEREFYRIDHRAVAMAILVHPSFPDEESNGVALTTNIFNPNRPGQYVNVQIGSRSVANPGPGELSDQFILYTWYSTPEAEYLSRSNQTDEAVLTWEEILTLSEALTKIHNHFKAIHRPRVPSRWGMDVEFKFTAPHGRLLIKQARPIPQP